MGSKVLFSRPTIAAEWESYLKVMNGDIINASNLYKNSAKERADVLKEFVDGNGSMTHIFNNVPFTRKEDEPRIILMIKDAIANQEIPNIKIKGLPKRK